MDEKGRAFQKSQLQMQVWVNRRRADLTSKVLDQLPDLRRATTTLEWVSPLEEDHFREYYDRRFLDAIEREDLWPELRAWWPRRGPQWDALAIARDDAGSNLGPVLVEAKSWPGEQYGRGTAAKEQSRAIIRQRLKETRAWLGVDDQHEPMWLGPLYQSANRLAALFWFTEVIGQPAWLVNMYFVGDRDAPTTEGAWKAALSAARGRLGLGEAVIPCTASVYLEAGTFDELVRDSRSDIR